MGTGASGDPPHQSSGIGRELGPGAVAAYQQLKTVYA
jgi:hypothetical protein